MKFDYSQVNPFDKNTLKLSQRPSGGQEDQLVDSLQLDRDNRDNGKGLEERGQMFLQRVDEIKRAETMGKMKENEQLRVDIMGLESTIQQLRLEMEGMRAHLQAAVKESENKDVLMRRLEEKGARMAEEAARMGKELKAANEKIEQLKNINVETKKQLGGLEKQKQGAERDNSQMAKMHKRYEGEIVKRDQK